MRLVSFATGESVRLGAQHRERVIDVQNAHALGALGRGGADVVARAMAELPSDMLGCIRVTGGVAAAREAIELIDHLSPSVWDSLDGRSAIVYRPEQVRLLAPISNPPKIICLGLNYRDHAAESGMPVPSEPILFSKYATSIVGPGDAIRLPSKSNEVDYEAELVLVIGKGGRDISESEAAGHVAGYTCGNDISARDYQLKKPGGQWMAGKTFDTFAPIGPALVTPDELGDPHSLSIGCVLNGETMQNSNTDQLVFNVPQMIAYVSHIMTLEVGDLIFTGTPPGVGFARKPPVFLRAGDTVEIRIDGIGSLINPVVAG